MKKIVRILAVMAGMASLFSCAKSNDEMDSKSIVHFIVNTEDISTKTFITEGSGTPKVYTPSWKYGDEIGILLSEPVSDAPLAATFSNVNPDGAIASFTGDAEASEAGTLYAFYPASSFVKCNNGTVGLNIPETQNPTASSFDPKADILIAKPEAFTVSGGKAEIPQMSFKRLPVILKVTLSTDYTAARGEYINSLKLTAESTLTGRAPINLGTAAIGTINPANKDVIAEYSSDVVAVSGTNNSVYLAVNPATLASGSTLKFEATGDNYIFTKTITLSSEVVLKSGTVKPINITFAEADCKPAVEVDYTGEWMIIGENGDKTYAMMSYSAGNNLKALEVSKNGEGKIGTTTAGYDCKVTITKTETGSYAGMYTIADANGKFLYAAGSGSNNYMKATETIPTDDSAANYYWDISQDSEGVFTIKATKSSNNNVMRFNSGSSLFSCYGSASQKAVSLYKYSEVIWDTTPALTLLKTSIAGVAAAGAADVSESGVYSLVNATDADVTVTCDGTVVTAASVSGGALKYTVSANSGAARDGWVKFTLNAVDYPPITVSQLGADAAKTTILDLTTKEYGGSAYSGTFAYGDWTIVNGANNNKGWAYCKMGGKSETLASSNPCYIYTNKAVTHKVTKATVHLPAGSLSKSGMSVNSWGIYVYSDAAMSTQIDYVAGGTITSSEGSFDFVPSAGKTWIAGYYYKVSWDLANTTGTNGVVCVDKITLAE